VLLYVVITIESSYKIDVKM